MTRSRAADFLELTKPRITLLVLATTMVGFYLAAPASIPLALLSHTLLGIGLVAGGASALNMWLERRPDSLMRRTAGRPLPSGRLQSGHALSFALVLSGAGLVYLFLWVNHLTSALAVITLLTYLFLYTPLKTRTWLCTLVGAVPGALPPILGWIAATGKISLGGILLFVIVFLWQLPHFYAIGWMYREDYARAGFPMLPVIDTTGRRTGWQASAYILALILVTLLPTAAGLAGFLYLAGAVLSGICFLVCGVLFARLRDFVSARRLFVVSVFYLPLLMALLVIDKASP
ncbi:MAG: protoheme IX farnesyltransferase [Acidobacteria bacterium]|nr:MAG: protoheme IX farnesyltransferase [Acidobacteriota bacterium]PYV05941.1 MAG: protoheme IX farnesyltransferase [Acidobacteriota bacterium]